MRHEPASRGAGQRRMASRGAGLRRMASRAGASWLKTVAAGAFVATLALTLIGCSWVRETTEKKTVKVPDVAGLPALDAVHELQWAGLALGSVDRSPDPEVAAFTVLGQDPAAGELVEEGSAVALTISSGSELVAVPEVTGMTTERATSELEDLGLDVYEARTFDAKAPKDTVMGQLPQAGTGVTLGSTVGIIVSRGKAPAVVAVPGIVNKTQAKAVAAIEKAGLRANPIAVYDSARAGVVVRQEPKAKTKVAPGSTVDILVSQGAIPAYTVVPRVVGKWRSAAVEVLKAAGLKPSVQEQYSGEVTAGKVIFQIPNGGSKIAPGEDVGIFVSLGPEPLQSSTMVSGPQTAKVPDVAGMSRRAAIRELEGAGFTVKVVDVPTSDVRPGIVVQQFPTAGTTVIKGSAVLIGVAKGILTQR